MMDAVVGCGSSKFQSHPQILIKTWNRSQFWRDGKQNGKVPKVVWSRQHQGS